MDDLWLRWLGHRIRAATGIVVDGGLTVVQAHEIADQAHHRLLHDVPRLDDATVHVNPDSDTGHDHHASTGHHRPAATRRPAQQQQP